MKGIEFNRILVTNRGEIARRIIRTIHDLGKVAMVVYAEDDGELPFVTEADESFSLGSGDLSQTYLNVELIIKIARAAQADAIHPGYGFLAEHAGFARACAEAGIDFIGPSAEMIDLMGHKSRARDKAAELGVPVLEGETGTLDALLEKASLLPYPLLIKPAAGGGGKGMRIVKCATGFEEEARDASREALNYFGSGELYVEQFLEGTRHVEVQVLADHHGNSVHLFERECSLQRRYQKIVEEAPSLFISESTRKLITTAALELIRGIGYTNAGTVEFLMDPGQNFYFMEMNTRIQVEHPLTESITGVDLVREQIMISQGHALSFSQDELSMKGHALEVRIYAENPGKDFLPSSGSLDAFDLPGGRDVRIDSGYVVGNLVESRYDPMLAKLIVKGESREDARIRMLEVLKQTHIAGLYTNRDFLVGLLRSDHFRLNTIHTRLIDLEMQDLLVSVKQHRAGQAEDTLLALASFITLQTVKESDGSSKSPWHQMGPWRLLPGISLQYEQETHFIKFRQLKGSEHLWLRIKDREFQLSLEGRRGHHYRIRMNSQFIDVWGKTDRSEISLDLDGQLYMFRRLDILDRRYIGQDEKLKNHSPGEIAAPLNGKVVQVHVKEGDRVTEGLSLVVIESMKMENTMLSDQEAIVKQIKVSPGQQVRTNQILLTLASI